MKNKIIFKVTLSFAFLGMITSLASCGTKEDTSITPQSDQTSSESEDTSVAPEGEHHYSSDWSFDNAKHWHACTDAGYESLKKDEANHSFVDKVVNPTYDAKGYTSHTCSVCGYSYNDSETDQLVHHYSNTWSYNDTHHYHACTDAGYESLKKDETTHSFGKWIIDKEATSSETGLKHRDCAICHYSQEEVIPVLTPTVDDLVFTLSSSEDFYSVGAKPGTKATTLVVPDTYNDLPVTQVASEGFSGFNTLERVILPSSITYVGWRAFKDSTALKSLYLPDNVTEVRSEILAGCSSLESINVPFIGQNPEIQNDSSDLLGFYFRNESFTGGIYSTCYYRYGTTHYYLPIALKEVTVRGGDLAYAFNGCTYLETITLLDDVSSIGAYSFAYCDKLANLKLPQNDGIQTIGNYAFMGCSKIRELNIPQNVVSIGESAFNGCVNLGNLVLPDTLTTINASAFTSCRSIINLVVPSLVTTIGNNAFDGCTRLIEVINKSSLSIVSGNDDNGKVAYYAKAVIDDEAESAIIDDGNGFIKYVDTSDCVYLVDYYSEERCAIIPDDVDVIYSEAFSYSLEMTELVIPQHLSIIQENAFTNCPSLTNVYYGGSISNWMNITLGNSVSNPMYYGINFYLKDDNGNFNKNNTNYSLLTELVIPNTINVINDNTFFGFKSLTSVTLHSGVSSIGENSFSNCYNVYEVINKSSLEITKESYSYGYIGYYAKEILDNEADTKLSTDSHGFVTYNDGVDVSLLAYKGNEEEVTIPSNVTRIAIYSMAGKFQMKKVVVPNNVATIEMQAFQNNIYLEDVTIPFVGKTRTSYSVDYLSVFGSIFTTINQCVDTIPIVFVNGASYTPTYYVPASIKTIRVTGNNVIVNGSLSSMHHVENLYLGGTLTDINVNAFREASYKNVILSNSITTIRATIPEVENLYYHGSLEEWCSINFPQSGVNPAANAEHFYVLDPNGDVTFDNEQYTEINGTLVIPDSVTTIGAQAFYGLDSITGVEFGSGVTSIGDNAFANCTNLESISIPDNVSIIGANAFYCCNKLTSVDLGKGVTSIGASAFCGDQLISSVTIPNSVTSIGSYAFQSCQGLENITFESGSTLESIPMGTFQYCSSLEGITLPDSLLTISSYAFDGCNSLEEIIIPSQVTSIGDYAFRNCSNIEEFVIGESVTTLGSNMLLNCTSLTEVNIPNSVTTINSYAFKDCSNLEEVNFGTDSYLTTIGNYAFHNCSSLVSIALPNSITSMGDSSFSGCSSLTSMTIPFIGINGTASSPSYSTLFGYIFGTTSYTGGVATTQVYGSSTSNKRTYYIPETLTSVTVRGGKVLYGAFSGCQYLEEINLPASINSYPSYLFSGCSSLTSHVIPSSVTTINSYAFKDTGLATIEIPNTVTSVGSGAFANCDSLTTVNFASGSTITTLGTYLFSDCDNLVNVTLPDSLTTLPNYTFSSCDSLANITLPASLTTISNYAFEQCSSLTSFTIPEGVTTLQNSIFYNCANLETLVIPSSVTSIGSGICRGCSSLVSVTVPFAGSSSTASTGASTTLFGYLFGNSSYTGSTAISSKYKGSGSTTSYTYYVPNTLRNVTINGSPLLYGSLYNYNMVESVTIGENVTTIGDYALYNCSNLTSVTIYKGVTNINAYAFQNCSSLTTINFTGTVAEWNAISKASTWRSGSSINTIVCSDNTINL